MSTRGMARTPWVLYFDGAIRSKGGPAGIGAVLKNGYGHIVATVKSWLRGGVSQNLAEYKALIAGLEKAKWHNVQHLLVKGDSLFTYNQVPLELLKWLTPDARCFPVCYERNLTDIKEGEVLGHWEVRDESLKPYWRRVTALAKEFKSFRLEHIPREYNEHADRLANEAIDSFLAKSDLCKVYGILQVDSDCDSDDERYHPPAYRPNRYFATSRLQRRL